MSEKEIDPSFPAECLEYKQLLRELRKKLGLISPHIVEFTGVSRASIDHYFLLPYLETGENSRALAPLTVHKKIVKLFATKATEKRLDISADIQRLNELHLNNVTPELERRKNALYKQHSEIAKRRFAKSLDDIKQKTLLTSLLITRLQASGVNFTKVCFDTGGSLLQNSDGFGVVISLLDNPAQLYDDFRNKNSARVYLERILNYEKFGFSDKEKAQLIDLFFVNCEESAKITEADCPVITYKRMLKALMLQAGLTENQFSKFISCSWEFVRQLTSEEERYIIILPSKEDHCKICSNLKEKSLAPDLLEQFERQYTPAFNEKVRLIRPNRTLNQDGLPSASIYIAELMQEYKITVPDICNAMGISRHIFMNMLKCGNVEGIFGVISAKPPLPFKDEGIPTFDLEGYDLKTGKEIWVRENVLGEKGAGQKFVLGFSGVSSWAQKVFQEKLKSQKATSPALG